MFTKLSIAGVVSAVVLLAAWHANSASAQYPPPNGNCTVTIDTARVDAGGSANVKIVVRDVNGNPVPNAAVTVVISKQPGSGASVTMNSSTTDANGVVTGTVKVGSTAGVVEVSATPQGTGCSAQVVAGQGAVAPEVALPSTGTGTGSGGAQRGIDGMLVLLTLAGAGVVAAGAAARRAARG